MVPRTFVFENILENIHSTGSFADQNTASALASAPRRRRRNFAVSNGFRHDIITNFDTIDQYHDARMSIPT